MGKKKTRWWIIGIVLFALAVPTFCFAAGEDTDPRDYIPAPGGTDAFILYYRNISGDQIRAGGKYVSSADLRLDVAFARYAHYWAPTDKLTFVANAVVPFGSQHLQVPGNGTSINDTSSGLGDIALAGAGWWNFVKSPSLSFWNMLCIYAIPPTGEYDKNKSVNFGTNRWDFRIVYAPIIISAGNFTFETVGAVDFYTNNNNYTSAGLDLKQDPIYSVNAHVSYNVTKAMWVGATYDLHTGGETEINGVKQGDSFIEHFVMGSVGIQTTPNTTLLFQYGTDVSLDQGTPTNQFRIRFAYSW